MTALTPHPAWSSPVLQVSRLSRRDILKEAEGRLGVRLIENRQAPGGGRPSVGMPTDRRTWARISWHRPGDIFPREFSGLEASTAVREVPKPEFVQAVHWVREGVIFRAEEMTLIDDPTVAVTYCVDRAPDLSERWWEALASALDSLARTDTDRVSLVQENIDNSITEAFAAPIDTTISQWVIGHGDLHWGNLTAPRLFLLDWDSWGLMPRGLDAAKLWEAAYRIPEFADEVAARFAHDLSTRDGKLCQLWVCANRILGARRRGRITDQTENALYAVERLLHELSS